ncbi:hypothetical protein BDZ89DRAFT_1109988 [Hymenopellis radicata]|nr:hypothetical protein BDZ89DRAFT_1109988 [Hymenopellis radicata]
MKRSQRASSSRRLLAWISRAQSPADPTSWPSYSVRSGRQLEAPERGQSPRASKAGVQPYRSPAGMNTALGCATRNVNDSAAPDAEQAPACPPERRIGILLNPSCPPNSFPIRELVPEQPPRAALHDTDYAPALAASWTWWHHARQVKYTICGRVRVTLVRRGAAGAGSGGRWSRSLWQMDPERMCAVRSSLVDTGTTKQRDTKIDASEPVVGVIGSLAVAAVNYQQVAPATPIVDEQARRQMASGRANFFRPVDVWTPLEISRGRRNSDCGHFHSNNGLVYASSSPQFMIHPTLAPVFAPAAVSPPPDRLSLPASEPDLFVRSFAVAAVTYQLRVGPSDAYH